jgi:uncharacterized protein
MSICSYIEVDRMVKPKKCRLVSSLPGVTYFKPAGIPLKFLSEVCISVEEIEALRLKDVEGLEQAEGAARMEISRPTFQRVLSSARKKVAEALVSGKAMRIEGGSFSIAGEAISCPQCRMRTQGAARIESTLTDVPATEKITHNQDRPSNKK